MSKEKWIIVNQLYCGEVIPSWWETDENNISTPVTYDTSREAYLQVVEILQWRIKTFLEDKSEEYLDNEHETVVPCTVTPDGIVNTEFGELFSPFKPQENYGR